MSFCYRCVTTYFIVVLLRRIVVLWMVSFFIGFRIDGSDVKIRSDIIIILNHIHKYVANIKYYVL